MITQLLAESPASAQGDALAALKARTMLALVDVDGRPYDGRPRGYLTDWYVITLRDLSTGETMASCVVTGAQLDQETARRTPVPGWHLENFGNYVSVMREAMAALFWEQFARHVDLSDGEE